MADFFRLFYIRIDDARLELYVSNDRQESYSNDADLRWKRLISLFTFHLYVIMHSIVFLIIYLVLAWTGMSLSLQSGAVG